MPRMLMLLLCGCFAAERPRPPEVLATNVDGAALVSPTQTLAVQLSLPIDPRSAVDSAVLVRGEADGALLAALEHPPIAARFLTRLVAVRTEAIEATLLMTPRRALEPGARYTLVVGAALRAGGLPLLRPLVRAFTTGSLAGAAPVLSLADPPDGAAGVVRNLRSVEVVWSKPMPRAVFEVVRDDGEVWPSHSDGLRITLLRPLDGDRAWQVVTRVTDGEGRPPFGDPPAFSTGRELRMEPPRPDGLVLQAADTCLVARFATARPTWAELCVADRCQLDPPSVVHALGAALDDPVDGWSLRVWDESTAPHWWQEGEVRRPPVPLVLTEVLSEPRGERLTQQFVELYNVGLQPVATEGLALCTQSGCDNLPHGELPSGGWAVVVGSAFSDDGVDARPAPGALVLRLGNSRLGGRGIKSGGEPVWLESGGTLVTRWGGWPAAVAPGQSVARRPYQCDLPASFRPGPATPGGP